MTGRLFVASRGELRPVDPDSSFRPRIDCARCNTPVRRQLLLQDGEGGWYVSVRCHGDSILQEDVLWRELLAGNVVVGPAFDPDLVLVRRAP